MTLPLASSHARTAAAAAAAVPSGAAELGRALRRRVLVVDDSPDAAESLAELVQLLGHDADVAHDGPAALELARARRPDLVLCDVGLPGMDGYEVARRLRAHSRTASASSPVSGGYAQPEDVVRAIEAGFDGHVAKPADPEQLAILLR